MYYNSDINRKLTRWGFYEPKAGILPFKDDNGFDEWYYVERDERGETLTWILIFKTGRRAYTWSVNLYGNMNVGRNGSTTTLRKAMIKATNTYRVLLKGRVRIRVIT